MSNKVTLGGDRLGAGQKQQVDLKTYNRSTHDLSYIWRSTMASGTLVPFMSEVALPGDSFDIDLDVDIKTHPTIGPLFGSYKVQLDIFQVPIRLYNGKLHMNMLNVGLDMSRIKLPQVEITTDASQRGDNSQINPSALLSYLNIRGIGSGGGERTRQFNAVPLLAYWDIYKNYYANKQEEIGVFIHNAMDASENTITDFAISNGAVWVALQPGNNPHNVTLLNSATVPSGRIKFVNGAKPRYQSILVRVWDDANDSEEHYPITAIWNAFQWEETELLCYQPTPYFQNKQKYYYFEYNGDVYNEGSDVLTLKTFALGEIDSMRERILMNTQSTSAFVISRENEDESPYVMPLREGDLGYCLTASQEGLGIKTYQSDLFNNWISTEWLDGDNGINAVTAVSTIGDSFTINTLNLSQKVYEMLNQIAVSGGTYDDWLNAVYSHERTRSTENPVYMGGLIKELAFQEVVSTSQVETQLIDQPLGTLAGKGVLTKKHKGGKINVKTNEPSYIMGIISLTPRIDYSQGNKWDVNLKTLDDLHKPALDGIGFQDLITDQMAWWDTVITDSSAIQFKSAGKQPAWINYMTNVNQVRGNFADEGQQMFMTLNRRYENQYGNIADLTTYIDPRKFNNIFANTQLDAQNFWAQIAVNITARRKMSAKVMPNL